MDAQLLQWALETVRPAIQRRTSLPILNHVLIEQNGHTSFVGTDLDLWIKIWVNQTTGEDFTALVEPARLLDLAKSGGGDVLMSPPHDGKFTIETASGRIDLEHWADVQDFPVFPEVTRTDPFEVESEAFIKDCERVIKTASRDGSRYGLDGILFNGADGTLVSTDASRLTELKVDWLSENIQALVPANKLASALKSIKKAKEPIVTVGFNEKHMVISGAVLTVVIRLMDGEYPNYKGIVSQERPVEKVYVDKAALLKALKTVKTMVDSRHKAVTLWAEESDRLFLRLDRLDLGGFGQTWIDCRFDGGIPEPVAVNIDLLLGLVRSQEAEVVTLALQNGAPCYVNDEMLYPMRDSLSGVPEGLGETVEAEPVKETPVVHEPAPEPPVCSPEQEPTPIRKGRKTARPKNERKPKVVKKTVEPTAIEDDVEYRKIWIAPHFRTSKLGKKYEVAGHWRKLEIKVKVEVKKAA